METSLDESEIERLRAMGFTTETIDAVDDDLLRGALERRKSIATPRVKTATAEVDYAEE